MVSLAYPNNSAHALSPHTLQEFNLITHVLSLIFGGKGDIDKVRLNTIGENFTVFNF
jgi:hypothetical protein